MIFPKQPQTLASVADHYNELDSFYREIWGEHVHHGYWPRGDESASEAAEALVALLAAHLRLMPGQQICDIGCGYGATAQYLAQHHAVDVTGVTISAVQAELAAARAVTRGGLRILLQDWLNNRFASMCFDRVYAVESSEHMTDKQRFFDEAFRTVKPDGLFVVCAWLTRGEPGPWEIHYLLEPICREGRLPSMGDEGDYCRFAERAGFRLVSVEDISRNVRRTWSISVRRALGKLATERRYCRFLFDRAAGNRVFAATMVRMMIAYRTGSLRYCVLVFRRPGL